MKRWIVGVSLGIFLFSVFTALVGGFHYRKFVRYVPEGEAEFESKLEFKPHLSATLFGSDRETIIPFFLYYRGERDGDGHVTIQTEHENDPRYGYDALTHLELQNLTVVSDGERKTLITKNSPVRVNLNTERWASRLQRLGVCEGEEIQIEVIGVAHTKTGTTHDFRHKRTWKKSRSSRWEIGLAGMP